MASTSSLSHFFSASRHYLVLGASASPGKFGYKVLNWYIQHQLPVTPLNPTTPEILGLATKPNVTAALNALSTTSKGDISSVGMSVITPPSVTLHVLSDIRAWNLAQNSTIKVDAVWFQPGSYDNSVLQAAEDAGIKYIVAYDDCILVLGNNYLRQSNI